MRGVLEGMYSPKSVGEKRVNAHAGRSNSVVKDFWGVQLSKWSPCNAVASLEQEDKCHSGVNSRSVGACAVY